MHDPGADGGPRFHGDQEHDVAEYSSSPSLSGLVRGMVRNLVG